MLKFRLLTENEMKEMSKYGFGKIPKVTDFAILSGISGNYFLIKMSSATFENL